MLAAASYKLPPPFRSLPFPAMPFIYDPDLPLSSTSKAPNCYSPIIPNPAISALSAMSMGGNNGGTRQEQQPSAATVAQALEYARDSTEGAQDPAVATILETALAEIWRKIQTQPQSYVMTREEFAVFNFFQDRFEGQELAVSAKKRYWDNLRVNNGGL
jgi:hypothetical protein